MSCETKKHAEDPRWSTWELRGRTRVRESRLCPDCSCVVSRNIDTSGFEALVAGLACWCGVYAIISDIHQLIEHFNQVVAPLAETPPTFPSPNPSTIGELRDHLRASGWILAAGRQDGLTWAMIQKPGGDRIRVEDDAPLSDVITACLRIAASQSVAARDAFDTN